MALNRALSDYEASIRPDKPFTALLGGFVNGSFQFVVATNPTLAYVRHLDGVQTTAKHRNRVDLTLDPTDPDNQDNPIALYYDEYGDLAIWGLDPDQGGALLENDPTKGAGGVKSVTGAGVDNTDPVNPVITGSGNQDLFTQTNSSFVSNTTSETTLVSTGVGNLTLPPNWWVSGRTLHLWLAGGITTKALLAGTLGFRLYLDTAQQITFASGDITIPDGIAGAWVADLWLTCRSDGMSGVFSGAGLMDIYLTDLTHVGLTLAGGSNQDTTVSQPIDLKIQWGTADASNGIGIDQLVITYHDPN